MILESKTAIITGAGGHLGRGTAMRLAQEGACVLVNDINMAQAQKTVEMITRQGGQAVANGADVTRSDDVNDMIARVLDEWGQIDILVNNAGDIRDAILTKMTDRQWEFVIDLNLKGSFLCARAAAPHMIERKYGKIVNTASMAYKGNVGQANYSAAKSGVVGLTLAIGLELARYGINVKVRSSTSPMRFSFWSPTIPNTSPVRSFMSPGEWRGFRHLAAPYRQSLSMG
jgi:3-oxoacyl-[acyl-carrier protein] reductase